MCFRSSTGITPLRYHFFSVPSPGEPHSRRLLANDVADADRAGAKDLGAQATTVDQPFDYRTSGERLQVAARFAQPNAANLYLANTEFPADEMIERHAASDNIAARLTGSEFYLVIALQRLNCLRFNQG